MLQTLVSSAYGPAQAGVYQDSMGPLDPSARGMAGSAGHTWAGLGKAACFSPGSSALGQPTCPGWTLPWSSLKATNQQDFIEVNFG